MLQADSMFDVCAGRRRASCRWTRRVRCLHAYAAIRCRTPLDISANGMHVLIVQLQYMSLRGAAPV